MHPLEEQAALGALDDAVVVGAGDRDDLADAERAERVLVGTLELGRVVDAAHADDDALAGHEPRHALDGADGASGDGAPAESDVPDIEYCAGVSDWPEEASQDMVDVVFELDAGILADDHAEVLAVVGLRFALDVFAGDDIGSGNDVIALGG